MFNSKLAFLTKLWIAIVTFRVAKRMKYKFIIFQTFFTNRAQAYLQLGEYSKAVTDCREAIKIKPESVKSYVHLVKSYSQIKTLYKRR